MLGYSEAELLAMDPMDLLVHESKGKFLGIVKEALTGGKSLFSAEFEVKKKNGQTMWGLVHAKVNFKRGKPETVQVFAQDITEIRRTQENCKEAEEWFRSLVESTSDWIWQVDENAIYTYASPKVKDMLGYKPEEVLGKKPFDFMPKAEAEKIAEQFRKSAKEKRPFQGMENWNVHKNGSLVLLETSGVPILDSKGRLKGFRGIDRDITARKRIEEALRLSEEKFSKVFQYSPIAVALSRLSDGKIVDANQSATNMLGYTLKETVGQTTSMIKIWANQSDRMRLVNELRSKGFVQNQDFVFNKQDGTKVDVTLSASTIKINNEDYLLSSFIDITKRKKAEQELSQAKADWERTFDAVPDLIMIIDSKHKIQRANRAMAEKLGVTPQQAVGLSCFKAVHDAACPPAFCPHALTLRDGKEHVAEVHEPCLGGDFMVSTTPLRDENGRLIGSVHVARDITERKKAEEALKENKDRLQSILEAMDDGVALVETDGRVIDCNSASLKLLGLTKAEFIGMNVIDAVIPEERQRVKTLLLKLSEKGRLLTEFEAIRKPNSTFKAELSVTALCDKNGVPTNFIGVARDVTQRRKMEAELKESEQLYRTIFDNSEDGFLLIEPIFNENEKPKDFRILKINRAFEQQTGALASDVLGKLASETAPELEPEITLLGGRVVKTGKAIHDEVYTKYSNKWYDTYYFPYGRGQAGVLFRDITERKKIEESLRRSEESYRQLFNSMTEMFFVADILYDKQGKVTDFVYSDVNPAFLNFFNKPKEQVKDKQAKKLFEEIGVDESWLQQLDRINRSGKAFRGETFSKATSRFYNSYAWKIRNNQVGVIFYDITQRKALERQLQDKERLAAIGQTAGMIGHDIRNPLQAIVGEIFIAKDIMFHAPDSHFKREGLESVIFIQEQVDYINKIVSDLQDYSRPLKPDFTMVDLPGLISGVFDTINLPAKISLKIDVKGILKTDATFLKRIMFNLVNNAVQAMPDGGELAVTTRQKAKSVLISVSDSGVGISEEMKTKMFTPMTTTKSKGQGLGLAVVKRLVEALNGKITFESEKGKGTKFTIEFPCIQQ